MIVYQLNCSNGHEFEAWFRDIATYDQQAQEGERVHWHERKRGDLAFFKNDIGHIVHVGILKGPAQIVHAAGEVRLDRLEETGIWSGEQMTHVMAHICRI